MAAADVSSSAVPAAPSDWRRWARAAGRLARQQPLGLFGLLVVLALAVLALPQVAEVTAPYPYAKQDLRHRLEGPSSSHLLGTDGQGRDTLSRLIYGVRITVVVGFGAVAISELIAATIGVISGYYGGWFDKLFQRLVDIAQSLPNLVVLITVLGVMGSSLGAMVLAIGIVTGPGGSRLIRSQVLSLMSRPYVEAARVVGATDSRIMLTHILPNVLPLIILGASLRIGAVVLLEASLSFLGFGLPPPFPSWGQMLTLDGREYLRRAPGLAIFPGLAIGVAVFSFNVLGDALRDVLDPRLRRGGRR